MWNAIMNGWQSFTVVEKLELSEYCRSASVSEQNLVTIVDIIQEIVAQSYRGLSKRTLMLDRKLTCLRGYRNDDGIVANRSNIGVARTVVLYCFQKMIL